MKILAIDTSSKFLSLAVAEDEKILAQTHRLLDRKHSTQLALLIERILKKAKVPLKKIDGFCINKGPGSFTGLRVGITTVKGLAFVLQKPVAAIPGLDILVQNLCRPGKGAPAHGLKICPIIDARQNKLYCCLYQMQNGIIERKGKYSLLPVEELLKKLKGEVLFLGDGIRVYREEICRHRGLRPVFAPEKLWYPKAARAVVLALDRFRKGNTDDVNSLSPLYLYPKECQIK